jgi:hypothetical protein
MSRRRLDEAVARLEARESLCLDPPDPHGLCLTLLQKATLFGTIMKRTRLGLDLAEEARQLAAEHGLTGVAARAEAVREGVLAAALKGRP